MRRMHGLCGVVPHSRGYTNRTCADVLIRLIRQPCPRRRDTNSRNVHVRGLELKPKHMRLFWFYADVNHLDYLNQENARVTNRVSCSRTRSRNHVARCAHIDNSHAPLVNHESTCHERSCDCRSLCMVRQYRKQGRASFGIKTRCSGQPRRIATRRRKARTTRSTLE